MPTLTEPPADDRPIASSTDRRLIDLQRIAHVGDWSYDVQRRRMTWSDEMGRLYGIAPGATADSDFDCLETVHPEDRAGTEQAYAQSVAERRPLDLVHRVVAGDRTSYVRVRGETEFAADGRPLRSVGSAQDVTDEHLQVQALRATETRLRALFSAMSEGVVMQDHDGRLIDANPAAGHILGLSRDQLLGRTSMDPRWQAIRADGSPFPGHEHPAMVSLRTGEPLHDQLMGVRDPVRGLRWISINAVPVFEGDDPSVPSGVITTFIDVTTRRESEAALERLLLEQRAMLDNELVGMVRLVDRRSVWLNPAMGKIFGYALHELLGQCSRLLYLDDASYEALGAAAYPVLRAGGTFRTQLTMRRKDGTPVEIDLSASRLAPGLEDTLWLMVDLTPVRHAEAARTQALRLEAANRQFTQANAVRETMLSNVSHELRTPLNAILGFAQLLNTGAASGNPTKVSTYLGHIEASGKHLLRLIDSMLTHVAAESGRLALSPQPVDLNALFAEAQAMLAAEIAERQVTVVTEIDPTLGQPWLDPIRLQQLVLAFLSNAVKFNVVGGRVALRAHADGPRHLRIEVEDTGIGIAEDQIPGLFTDFHQLSAGHARSHTGLGMGLALARRLAEAQGGSVGGWSTLGVGSIFHVRLPLVSESPETAD